jgi:hypothetical protein
MEENAKILESLIESATEYGKTSIELIKLKSLDKATDIVSSLVPLSVVIVLLITFLLFFNIGIALWLGDILGKPFYGFFAVAGFYILTGLIIHFLLNKWIKRQVGDLFVRRMLK